LMLLYFLRFESRAASPETDRFIAARPSTGG
jgi:hypothetical protein